MMRSVVLIPILALLFLQSGCGGPSQAETEQKDKLPEKVTSVRTATVQAGDLEEIFTLPGTLEAWEDLTLAVELSGVVRWVGPREGDRVRRCEAILRIDPDTLEANLARDQAEHDLRRRHAERLERLAAQNFVSRQEVEDAQKALSVAEAALRISRLNLEKSTLRSPVDGVLDRRLVERGEYVQAGTAAAVVVQVDKLQVIMDVPEKDVSFLQVGGAVRVRPASIERGGGEDIAGEILHVAFKADPVTRTYRTKAAVDNAKGKMRPGMIVRVVLNRQNLQEVVAVPLFALVERGGGKAVFVAEEGVARLRPVRPAQVIGDKVVVEGLRPGEKLIVQGQQLLSDGAPVQETEG